MLDKIKRKKINNNNKKNFLKNCVKQLIFNYS